MLPRFPGPRTCLLLTLVRPLLILIHDEFGNILLTSGLIWEEIPLCSRIHESSVALWRPGPMNPLVGAHSLRPSPSPSWLLNVPYLILVKDLLTEGVLIQVTSNVRKDTRVWIIVPEDIPRSRDPSNRPSMAPVKVVSALDKRLRLPPMRYDSSCRKAHFFVRVVCQGIVVPWFQAIGSEFHITVWSTLSIRIECIRNNVIICYLGSCPCIYLSWAVVSWYIDGATISTERLIFDSWLILNITSFDLLKLTGINEHWKKGLFVDADVFAEPLHYFFKFHDLLELLSLLSHHWHWRLGVSGLLSIWVNQILLWMHVEEVVNRLLVEATFSASGFRRRVWIYLLQ